MNETRDTERHEHGEVCGSRATCGHDHKHSGETCSSPAKADGLAFDAVFLLVAVGLLFVQRVQGIDVVVGDLSITFVAIVCEAMPFMLAGALVGGLIEEFVPAGFLDRRLERNGIASVLLFAAAGIVFPVCECAIVPVAARLIRKGMPRSAALAFLLGVPIVNPIVAASTALAYQFSWNAVLLRMGCGYVIAVVAALVIGRWLNGNRDSTVMPLPSDNGGCAMHAMPIDESGRAAPVIARFFAASRHACQDFFDVGRYLFLGAFVAASARTLMSVEIAGAFMDSPVVSILAMMLLAVALNLCSEADAFIAAGFMGIVPASAQMAFMLLGPVLDLKLLMMYRTIFPSKVIVRLSLLTFMLVLMCSLIIHVAVGGFTNGP